MNREAWLEQMLGTYIRPHFQEAGFDVPEKIRVTCGWPHKMGVGKRKRRIGECWDSTVSDNGEFQIFISPVLSDRVKVVGVLIHEVVHAVVGLKHGHKKPFAQCAAKVGLVKPWTATTETPELVEEITRWCNWQGAYPHGAMNPIAMDAKAEKGRALKMECAECGCVIRTTRKWIDEHGDSWPCPCGGLLVEEGLATEITNETLAEST